MDNILTKIIANKQLEVEKQKTLIPISYWVEKITDTSNKYSLKESLISSQTGIIAEFKRRSPSKGWIFENAKIEDVLPLYEKNGAAGSSVLTDIDFFGGSLTDLEKARDITRLPLLRKDFTVDEYQLYQAKAMGANAILLIAAALSTEQNKQLAQKAKDLGLDVLLEIHSEEELGYVNSNVDIVGVNNRNLKTFVTEIDTSFRLVDKIPDEFVKISESGISEAQTVKELRQAGYKGFLMGENFMKTNNPGEALENFIKQLG